MYNYFWNFVVCFDCFVSGCVFIKVWYFEWYVVIFDILCNIVEGFCILDGDKIVVVWWFYLVEYLYCLIIIVVIVWLFWFDCMIDCDGKVVE